MNNDLNVSDCTFVGGSGANIQKEANISANASSFIINYGGTYSVTLKDGEGNAIAGENITFTLNGKNIGSANTDANGIAKIKLTADILKAAKSGTKNLVIALNSSDYNSTAKTVNIIISKEKTKITAKAKSFKKSKKIKKYAIKLKNSKGKAISKVQVSIKVGKKNFQR